MVQNAESKGKWLQNGALQKAGLGPRSRRASVKPWSERPADVSAAAGGPVSGGAFPANLSQITRVGREC